MAKVALENVRVDFPIYGAHQRSLRTAIFEKATGGLIHREGRRNQRVVIRALSNVSLTLEEGDRIGLVGHNGSGKSTLLKTIAGIYEPVEGSVKVEGRITPLFEMMPGLDVEDTGYENLFTSGMLLGMSRDLVEQKIPDIEEFSGLGEYLSLPVRTYSAGMTTRLGFALVTALNPDVLIMDEGFGAADLRFTEQAAKRMDEFIGRSRIMVLASHSDAMIHSICNKAALMQEGRILSVGSVDHIFEEYNALVGSKPQIRGTRVSIEPPVAPVYNPTTIREVGLEDRLARTTGSARIARVVAIDEAGEPRWTVRKDDTVVVRVDYEVLEEVPSLNLLVRLSHKSVKDEVGTIVANVWEPLSEGRAVPAGMHRVDVAFPTIPLVAGEFSFYIGLGRKDDKLFYDIVDENVAMPRLVVKPPLGRHPRAGIIAMRHVITSSHPLSPAT